MWTKPRRLPNGRFDPGQIGLVKMYQKYAGIPDAEYREMLRQHTGQTTSTAPALTQHDFDVFMPAMEIRAHLAECNGLAIGKRPGRIKNWYYWRRRCPKLGQITTRERWKIEQLWKELLPYIPFQTLSTYSSSKDYLLAIAAHATGKHVCSIQALLSWQALAVISALTDRLKYASPSVDNVDADTMQVPF